MALKIVTAATEQPISLAEAKAHLRVDHSDDDTYIDAIIKAATRHAEQFMGRALMEQTWDYYLDEFPDGAIKLPMPPLSSVTGLFVRDSSGAEEEIDSDTYDVDQASEPARLVLAYGQSWPTTLEVANAVRLRFVSGYIGDDSPNSANVPSDIRAAILLIIGTLWEQRETVVIGQSVAQLPWSAEQLLRPYRVHTAIG